MAGSGYRYGDGDDYIAIPEDSQTIDGTTPIVSKVIDIRDLDTVSFQLISADLVEPVTVTEGDSVVAEDTEFFFAAFDFTGLEDAVVTISGAAEEGNNGSFVITTGADGSFVAAGAVGLVDEDFDPETVTVTITHAEDPAQGAWTFEVSNNFQPGGIAAYGQVAAAGDWSSVTTLFDPTAVTAPNKEFVQANIRGRSLRATFTPTDGLGTVRANVNGKSWS